MNTTYKRLLGLLTIVTLLYPKWVCAAPFAGQTLHVLSFQENQTRAVRQALPKFVAWSGATVQFDSVASAAVAGKIGTDQVSGGTYDLYTVDEPFVPQFAPFFVPLAQWPKTPDDSDDKATWQSITPAARAAAIFQNVAYGLPVSGNVYIYVNRRDLWDDPAEKAAFARRYGYPLTPSASLGMLLDTAEFFTRPPLLYGFAPFTRLCEGTSVEALWFLQAFGTSLLDTKLQVSFDERKATAAFTYYKRLLAFAPPGARNWHHAERMRAYAQGRLAQILTWPSLVHGLEQEETSMVVGKSAYGLVPAGVSGTPISVVGSWVLAIPKTAHQPALAAAFARWWTSLAMGPELVRGGLNPVRTDLLSEPELVRQNPWFPVVAANFAVAVTRPRFPDYKEVSDILSRHFTAMIADELTPAEAAAAIRAQLVELTTAYRVGGHTP